MKTIATSLLLLVSVSLHAQYQSFFGQNSTEWSETISNLGGTFSYQLTISGDTTIASLNYKKIQGSFNSFLREDTTIGKIWVAYNDLGFVERIAADYSLTLGDTFIIKDPMNPFSDTAVIVDSVYMLNGRKHIRFNYGYIPFLTEVKLLFIEGVGTTYGLFYQVYEFNFTPYLLCKFRDNVQEYTNTAFNGNCIVTGLQNDEVQERLRLIRQEDGYIVVMDSDNEPMEIRVTDMQGRIIKAKYVPTGIGEAFIGLTDLSNGMYTISVYSNSLHQTTKILKQ
jgi:hypothetical protein